MGSKPPAHDKDLVVLWCRDCRENAHGRCNESCTCSYDPCRIKRGVRAIRHMIGMRTAVSAESEIRIAFRQVAKYMLECCPALFQDMELTEDSYRFKNEKV